MFTASLLLAKNVVQDLRFTDVYIAPYRKNAVTIQEFNVHYKLCESQS